MVVRQRRPYRGHAGACRTRRSGGRARCRRGAFRLPTGPDEWRAPAGAANRVVTARPDARAVAVRELDRQEVVNLVTRRSMLRTTFWSSLLVMLAGFLLGFVNFFWPRKVTGFGGVVKVPASQVPQPGADPVKIFEAKAFLVNLKAGEGVPAAYTSFASPSQNGGVLALYQKCPHLGCSVPWRPEFNFEGVQAWFRCPCHGSTFTKAGVRVFGPAPRPMDTMEVKVLGDGSVEINTGKISSGGPDNPQRAVKLT
ncbi:MAG: ubiquinol-cytochrome c reductase iron-sulfur subunit [Dehalococcoidia bacterium]